MTCLHCCIQLSFEKFLQELDENQLFFISAVHVHARPNEPPPAPFQSPPPHAVPIWRPSNGRPVPAPVLLPVPDSPYASVRARAAPTAAAPETEADGLWLHGRAHAGGNGRALRPAPLEQGLGSSLAVHGEHHSKTFPAPVCHGHCQEKGQTSKARE